MSTKHAFDANDRLSPNASGKTGNQTPLLVDGVCCPLAECDGIVAHSAELGLDAEVRYGACCPLCGTEFEYAGCDVRERSIPAGRGDARERAPGSERAGGPADRPHSYLELKRTIVDRASIEFEVCPVRCKCSFCPHCCLGKGMELRERLIPILSTWKSVFMLTLTVDPELFDDPEKAHRYVQSRRAISELVRALRKSGHLLGEHYFCVIEWQKNTKMAHYHLLLEAESIPFHLLCEIWNRNRPHEAGPIVGKRPGFGSVRFSTAKAHDGIHAACYATKYLLKIPEQGFPDWVLDYQGQMKRYLTSHGFWSSIDSEPAEAITEALPETVAVDESQTSSASDQDTPPTRRRQLRTIRERLERCCQQAVLLKVLRWTDPDGEEQETRVYFATCSAGFAEIRHCLEMPDDLPPKRFAIDNPNAYRLLVGRDPFRSASGSVVA